LITVILTTNIGCPTVSHSAWLRT